MQNYGFIRFTQFFSIVFFYVSTPIIVYKVMLDESLEVNVKLK